MTLGCSVIWLLTVQAAWIQQRRGRHIYVLSKCTNHVQGKVSDKQKLMTIIKSMSASIHDKKLLEMS